MKSVFTQSSLDRDRRTAMTYWRQPTKTSVVSPSLSKFRFTKVVDTLATIPGGRGDFLGFGLGQATIAQDQIAFLGTGQDGQSGIYQADFTGLSVIANGDRILPDTVNRFACFGSWPVFDQGNILFLGQEKTGRLRIYRDTPYRLSTIVSTDTPLLYNGGCFINLSNPVAQAGTVAFMGRLAESHQKGIFKGHQTPAQDLWVQKIVLVGEHQSLLRDMAPPAIDSEGTVVFRAQNHQGQMGLYRYCDDALEPILIANQTSIPKGSGCFTGFSDPLIDQGHVVFRGQGSVGQQGLYRLTPSGIQTIANSQMRIPGSLESFAEFKSFAVDGDDIAFLACDSHRHTSLFLANQTSLTKVIELGNRLDDKTIVDLSFGKFGLSQQSVVFQAQFVDGTKGLFRADFQG